MVKYKSNSNLFLNTTLLVTSCYFFPPLIPWVIIGSGLWVAASLDLALNKTADRYREEEENKKRN